MTLALDKVAAAIGSPAKPPAIAVSGWSVDSRSVAPGDVFFALRGPHHDGHAFVGEALAKGAAAAVVEQPVEAPGILLPVASTYGALKDLAAWARRQWSGSVVAVTGSAGKTTTKEAIAHLLAGRFAVGKSAGNYNNHVGVPLSLLRLPDNCEVAVLELAMNHAGEIAELAAIARPQIGVVTLVGHAHVEFFDSIEEVARAKRELIEALPPDGTAVLNADDSRVARFREAHSGPVVTFGFSEAADVRAAAFERTPAGARFQLAGDGWFETRLEGRHGVRNLLAALAVARVFGLQPEELAPAVAAFEPPAMRGRRLVWRGITILDDSYNANPEAVCAMLETLRETPGRRRIAVLGEMLELGRHSEELHRSVGRQAANAADIVIGVRGDARFLVEAAIEAGLPREVAFFFEEPEQAGVHLRGLAREGDVVLVKASRGTRIERVLETFMR